MPTLNAVKPIWWLVQKDLTRELRAAHVWPGMMLLGFVMVFLLSVQLELPADERAHVAGGLMWVAIFSAGSLAIERSFASEREAGCWQSLKLYPVAPSVVFLAKMAGNYAAVSLLEVVLVPAFIVLVDVPLTTGLGPIVVVAGLANLGFAAVGTLTSALTAGLRQRGGTLALLLLPLVTPIFLGAAEATRLAIEGSLDEIWWRWAQLLAVCAVLFTILGALVFEHVLEE
jgi:heme exporter protein B